jgi:hypothetical protein
MSLGLWHSAQLLYRIDATSLLKVTSFLPVPPALFPGPLALVVAGETPKHIKAAAINTAETKTNFFIISPEARLLRRVLKIRALPPPHLFQAATLYR